MSGIFGFQSEPAPSPLLTWVDVARQLSMIEPVDAIWKRRPAGLISATVNWSEIIFSVSDTSEDSQQVITWLRTIFPGRISDKAGLQILLDGPAVQGNLPIDFENADRDGSRRNSLGSIEGYIDFRDPSPLPTRSRPVPVIACHSVKGGTGRTTTAIALATSWAKKAKGNILLIDADLEAPGLSYLYRSTRPEIEISLEDLIVLSHAASNSEQQSVIRWVAQRLSGQRIGALLVLPLRRTLDELASSAIRAEHLSSFDRPYAFADLLSALAAESGCAGVVVDVRAGLVPLAAQLILDPQVGRIIVTSLASQALETTVALMSFVAREMRKNASTSQQPLLVVNRVPSILSEIGGDEVLLSPAVARMERALIGDVEEDISPDESYYDQAEVFAPLAVVKLGEVIDLQVPSRRWEGFQEQLNSSGFARKFDAALIPWLESILPWLEQSDPSSTQHVDATTSASPSHRRKLLADFTRRLVAAETTDEPVETPLYTGPMRALATESSQLPIVICEGSKGTGKTLTARFLLSKHHWHNAVLEISGGEPAYDALLLPVFGSVQTSDKFLHEIDTARKLVSKELSSESPQLVGETRAFLRQKISERLDEKQWTEIWLDVIAWSAGFFVNDVGAGAVMLELLRQGNSRIIAIIEGVEELYESAGPGLQPVLRSLLIDLPLRLRSAPGRPVGLIVFARRDTVDAGVAQNRSQFRQQYQDYALTWGEDDVLELAAWLATKSGALNIWDPGFREKPKAEKEKSLFQLWGRKLGPDEQPGRPRVQEAYTAGWVIAALSDLQERLVARDLVRFLNNAASDTNQTEGRENYGNRLLFPKAIREAIGPTSRSKIDETQEEIPELASAFDKFKANSNQVKAPIDASSIELLDLKPDEIDLLKLHGIILGDAAPFEVPELFRMGLGLRHAGARYSVIGTRRRARQRLAQGS